MGVGGGVCGGGEGRGGGGVNGGGEKGLGLGEEIKGLRLGQRRGEGDRGGLQRVEVRRGGEKKGLGFRCGEQRVEVRTEEGGGEIGRAHVRTPVTLTNLVWRPPLEKKKLIFH